MQAVVHDAGQCGLDKGSGLGAGRCQGEVP